MPHPYPRRSLPAALLGLALLLGCSPDDPIGAGQGNNRPTASDGGSNATPTPDAGSPSPSAGPTASPTPAVTPTPTPTPAPTPTIVSGGTDTGDSEDPLPTISPPTQPTPGATPVGTVGPTLVVSGGLKAIAAPSNASQPWIARTSDLAQLDVTGQVTRTYATGLSQPSLLAAHGADLWVVDGTSLKRLAPDVFASSGLEAVGSYPMAAGANGLAVDDTEAWVTHTGGTLTRITRSNGAIQTFAVTSPKAIALDATHAWVAGAPDKLYQIARTDGTVIQTFTVGSDPVAVARDGAGTVWTANATGQSLSRLATSASAPTSFDLGGTPTALLVDTNRLWVALSTPKKAVWLGLDGTTQGSSTLSFAPRASALDALGRVWFADPTSGSAAYVWGR